MIGDISPRRAAYLMRDLSENPSVEALRALAKNLDLPMEDAEIIDFLRAALKTTSNELRASEHEHIAAKLRDQ